MTSDSDPAPNDEQPETNSMPKLSSLGNRGVPSEHSLKDVLESKSLPESSSSSSTGSGLKVGPYRILEEIGRGGLGVVFLAEQDVISHEGKSSVKRKVAVKVIQQPRHANTIIDECESLAAMNHPNIATIYVGGIEEMTQMPYFALEYVDGTPLTKYCRQNRLTIKQRLDLFIQICNGIQHAHQKQVIHSDLKPANILVTTVEGKPVPKIIDFGLSSNLESQIESGGPSGTWEYMPPEQAKGKRLDIKADIYSLGVILFELMTGTLPIPSETFTNRRDVEGNVAKIQETKVPFSSDICTSCRQDFETHCDRCDAAVEKHFRFLKQDFDCIIYKAISKDPADRYDSANALADDVSRAINHEIPKAKQADTAYVLKKFVQRNRGLVSAIVAIIALLTVGTTTTTWKWIEANRQTEKVTVLNSELETTNQTLKKSNETITNQKEAAEAQAAQSNFQLAVSRWENDQPIQAMQFLGKIQERYRELEWYIARLQFRSSDLTISQGEDFFSAVHWTDDKKLASTFNERNQIKVWDLFSGQNLLTVDFEAKTVTDIAFDSAGTLVGISSANEFQVFDLPTQKQLQKVDVKGEDHVLFAGDPPINLGRNGIRSIQISPDRTRVVTGSRDGYLRMWDLKTGKKLWESAYRGTFGPDETTISDFTFSPDGKIIYVCGDAGFIKRQDVDSGKELDKLKGHENDVIQLAVNFDGSRLVAADTGGTIYLWDTAKSENIWKSKIHRSSQLEFSPSGEIVLSVGKSEIKTFDTNTGRDVESHKAQLILDAAFSPDGARFATAGGDLQYWTLFSPGNSKTVFGHDKPISSIAYSPDGSLLATGEASGRVNIWDSQTLIRKKTLFDVVNMSDVNDVAFSDDNSKIAIAYRDGDVKIKNIDSKEELASFVAYEEKDITGPYTEKSARSVDFNDDGSLIAYCSPFGFRVSEVKSKKEVFRQTGDCQMVRFCPGGKQVIVLSNDGLSLWKLGTWEKKSEILGEFRDIVFDRTGQWMAGTVGQGWKVWRIADLTEFQSVTGKRIGNISFGPNSNRIITSTTDQLTIWDLKSGEELHVISVGGRWYGGMDLQPNGHELALGCGDGGIRLLEFGSGPTDQYLAAKKKFLSQIPGYWHLFQAQKYIDSEKYFPLLFHLAWYMKSSNPTQKIQNIFQDRYEKLEKAVEDQGKQLDELPKIIRQMVERSKN